MTAPKPGAELERLAARVESAVGADREVDCLIAYASGLLREYQEPMDRHGTLVGVENTVTGEQDALYAPWWPDRGDHRGDFNRIAETMRVPAFTGSIDAAMTLSIPGWVIRVSQIRFGMWNVELWRGDKSFKSPHDVQCIAASEPRARTAAWLRARAKS